MKLIICKSCFEFLAIEFLLNKKSAKTENLQSYLEKRMQINLDPDVGIKCIKHLEQKGIVKIKKKRYQISGKQDIKQVLSNIRKDWINQWNEEIKSRRMSMVSNTLS